MGSQENKKTNRRSTAVSGSLAYYNLLAGMNLARTSIQRTGASVRYRQSEPSRPAGSDKDELSNR